MEPESKVGFDRVGSECISYSKCPETRGCFITIAFQICSRVGLYYQERPRKQMRIGIKWDALASALH
jgi:hypothetical protein